MPASTSGYGSQTFVRRKNTDLDRRRLDVILNHDASAARLFAFQPRTSENPRPQGSHQRRPTAVTSKPANGEWPRTKLFYSAASCGGKSVFVRQLRGPHLSTWP